MKIEVGKSYILGTGEEVFITEKTEDKFFPYKALGKNGNILTFTENGQLLLTKSQYDIARVEEAPEDKIKAIKIQIKELQLLISQKEQQLERLEIH